MEWTLGLIGIIFLIIGLVGQAFQMRKIRLTNYPDGELASPNIFMNKSNFKWYAVIGIGIACWYAELNVSDLYRLGLYMKNFY